MSKVFPTSITSNVDLVHGGEVKKFITPSKEVKIKERKTFFPRRPCVQIDISNEIYVSIKKELKIDG